MATVELGYGYLGYQPDLSIREWMLQTGIPAMKEEFTSDAWDAWFRKAKLLVSTLRAIKPGSTSVETSSISKNKKKTSKRVEQSSSSSGSSEETSDG
jgi:hypothetical protein